MNQKLKEQKGSSLVVVLVMAGIIGVVTASTLSFSTTEKRLNRDAVLILEAKHAAEAVAEFGMAQLQRRFDLKNSFAPDSLAPKPGGNPLTLSTNFFTLMEQNSGDSAMSATRLVLPENPYDGFAKWGARKTELVGGVIPPGEWKFIAGTTPGNEFDPLRDRMVLVRSVLILGKATVVDEFNREKAAFSGQELQVRDAPLFSHAIFYNMDMEIAPGPTMDVVGGVHANGNLYAQANSGLHFHRIVTAFGDFYHGRKPGHSLSNAYGNVTFTDGDGNQVSMNSGGWLDSNHPDWREIASNRWNGNLQDASHGIHRHNPVAVDDYVPDDPSTGAVDDALNSTYTLIEPTRPVTSPDFNADVEEQKYAYKAGLTVDVDTTGGTVSLYTFQRDAEGKLTYDPMTGLPQTIPLTMPARDLDADGQPNPPVVMNLFSSTGTGTSEVIAVDADGYGGLRDRRRANKAIDIVRIDVGALKTYVEDNDSADWGGSGKAPQEWWNGIVYVRFPDDPGNPPGNDDVQASVDEWGVKLSNAQSIPNPTFAHTDDIYGTTFATNNVMYVQGHYNADGYSSTGSSTQPDSTSILDEPPSALVADAINILSVNWDDRNSPKNSSSRRATTFTEVSAAILTGLVPSDKYNNNRYSGGVENFPRFLEEWRTTLRYRGSMVALFESEIATEPWGSSNVYAAPGRDWGFHAKFAEGFYPPGTPNTRTYRRINFRNFSQAEYQARLDQLIVDMGL